MTTLSGYKRADGRVGFRNHILAVSMVSCANSVVLKLAHATNAIPITHEQGCIEFEQDHLATKLGLIGAGQNPNVGAVLLVALGCEQTNSSEIMDAIASTGKLVECISVQDEGGASEAIEKGTRIINALQEKISRQERVEVSPESLVVAVQCGGSDWTTALSGNSVIGAVSDLVVGNGGTVLMGEVIGFPGSEHILAARAVNHKVGIGILDMVSELKADFTAQYGQKIQEVNPSPGNKAGGITTLVEKSMGTIKKIGSSPIQGLLRLGDRIPRPGAWIVDARTYGPDAFCLTSFAILGANVTVFSTGRGTPIGSAVMPLIKLSGNPATYKRFKSVMDFDARVVIEGQSIKKTGECLYEYLLAVANGTLTKSERYGDLSYAIPREKARRPRM